MSERGSSEMMRTNPELRPKRQDVKERSKEIPKQQSLRGDVAFALAKLRREHQTEMQEIETHLKEFETANPELYDIFLRLKGRKKEDHEKAHEEIMETFFTDLERQYQAIPMTEAEIQETLSTEALSAMPLQEYVELLRRLPPRFLTHVTRQGIRDNISHNYGELGEFHHGFEGMVGQKEVVSTFDLALKDSITHETVKAYLEQSGTTKANYPSKEDALGMFEQDLQSSDVARQSSRFADGKAVHTALEIVADAHYGGETNNQIFVAWPATLIAKEYHIGTQLMSVAEEFNPDDAHKRSQFNDYWLLKKNTKKGSLPIDAGIIFLPALTEVDPRNGSRYALDEQLKPLENHELGKFENLLHSPEYQALKESLYSYMHEQERVKRTQLEEKQQAGLVFRHEANSRELERRREWLVTAEVTVSKYQQLCKQFEITDPRILSLPDAGGSKVQPLHGLETILSRKKRDSFEAQQKHEDSLRQLGIAYELAKNTIPAKEYWEAYFERTGYKPSKVIYYEQTDPTAALDDFKEATGIGRSASKVNLTELYKENIIGNWGIKEVLEPQAELVRRLGREVIGELWAE